MAYIFTQTGAEIQEILNKAAAQAELVALTWAELKALRDAGQLVSGVQYRITDFVTSTSGTATAVRSAGHAFDIIVTADNAATLNENARACLHDGDTYFAGANLAGWRLKYCLDNLPGQYGLLVGTDTPASVTIETQDEQISGTYTYNGQITDEEAVSILGADEGPWYEWRNGTEIILAINSATPDLAQIQTGAQMVFYSGAYWTESAVYISGDDITVLTYTAAAIKAKGTIYWMQDEWGNEAPWDFKNIQFLRNGAWWYTFSLKDSLGNLAGDLSLSASVGCAGNKIVGVPDYSSMAEIPYFLASVGKLGLFNNIAVADVLAVVGSDSSRNIILTAGNVEGKKSQVFSISEYTPMILDNIFIMHHQKANGFLALAKLHNWPSLQNDGEIADGVAVVEGGRILVVAPTGTNAGLFWSSAAVSGGGTTTTDRMAALADFNGKTNTAAQITHEECQGENYAPGFCSLYSFGNLAAGKWWLPSVGELMMIYANMNKINYALSLISGATQLQEFNYWSSTEYDASRAWYINFAKGVAPFTTKATLRCQVRPVSTFIA